MTAAKKVVWKYFSVPALALLATAGAYGQSIPLRMDFSGTSSSTAIDLKVVNTSPDEDNFIGDGTLGPFTYRAVRAIGNTPQSSSTCSGSNKIFLPELSGAAVFRFLDGSLLTANLVQGGDCINLANGIANCTLVFKVTGGTGRLSGATGMLTFTETVTVVIADTSQNPVLFIATGQFNGAIAGVGKLVRQDSNNGDSQ